MDMNPKFTAPENEQWAKLVAMQDKHIIFKTLGDGEITRIVRKNDLSGLIVYFFTNDDGGYDDKMDGNEFLAEVEEVRELTWGDGE